VQVGSKVRRAGLGISILTALALAAGCTSPVAVGHVSGGIRLIGGPITLQTYFTDHQAGSVVVRQDGQEVQRTSALKGHTFDLALPMGTYQVSAAVANYTCTPLNVTVTSASSKSIQAVCYLDDPIG